MHKPCSSTTAYYLCQPAFHNSPIGQAVLNIDGSFVEVNQAFCTLLRRTRENVIARGHDELLHPDETLTLGKVADRIRMRRSCQTEARYARGDANIMHALLSVSGIFQANLLQHIVIQLQDITELKRLQEDLQQNAADLEQFAYIASHDLREPLVTMAGFASLLQKKCSGELEEKGRHWVEEILNGTKQMERKIDDLLAFSRASRIDPQGEFPLGAAVEEARRALVGAITRTNASIILDHQLPLVQGDRSMVAQVFQNLFSNSIKYKSSKEPVIHVSAKRCSEGWVVSVSDNGIGFDMRHANRIFGVFQRLYTIDQYPGTGIGLAITKKIIERHGGRIWPESEPDKGTTFHFILRASQ